MTIGRRVRHKVRAKMKKIKKIKNGDKKFFFIFGARKVGRLKRKKRGMKKVYLEGKTRNI